MRPLGRGERLEPPRGGRAVCSTPTWQLLGAACLLQTEGLREATGRCVSPKNKTDRNSSPCQGREQLNSASVDSSAGSSKPPTQTRAKLGVRWGLNQAFCPGLTATKQPAPFLSPPPSPPSQSALFLPLKPLSRPPARQKSTLHHPPGPGYSLPAVYGLSWASHSQRWGGTIPLPLPGWLVGSTYIEGPSTWRAQDQPQTHSQGSPNKKLHSRK